MAQKVSDLVQECVEPIINDLGYQLVEVVYKKCYDGMNLEIVIDAETPITLDDCEKVHRALDKPLDVLNPTCDKPYIMSVASPGIDRPIKTNNDFLRNKGKEIEVSLFEKVDGKKNFKGVLVDFDDTSFTINNKTNQTFLKSKVASIIPVINIK